MRQLVFAWILLVCADIAQGDAIERMKPQNLEATRQAIAALAEQRKPVDIETGYQDVRAAMHVHSLLSHDSRSPLDEVLAGARAAGVRVLLFNEHPAAHYDYVDQGHRGQFDDVLVMPGAETEGYLAYPTRSIQNEKTDGPQAFADLVNRDGGLLFICHLEERLDWEIRGITGNEIYNTHADLKNDAKLMSRLTNPLTLLTLGPLVEKYPQEMFGALLDYPADYLAKWDALCQTARHTGVAGNDSHHNTKVKAILTDAGKVRVLDGVGEPLTELDPEKITLIKSLVANKKPGDVVFALDLDPYERSLRHVSTHLLLKEISPEAVNDALKQSRAYVSFDWLGDPTGFVYQAERGAERFVVGSELESPEGLTLRVMTALPGFIRMLRNGQEIATAMGRELTFEPKEPGVYRAEVWLNVAGERRPWILSNPIYIR